MAGSQPAQLNQEPAASKRGQLRTCMLMRGLSAANTSWMEWNENPGCTVQRSGSRTG